MRVKLFITGLIIISLLSCGIFDSDSDTVIYDIVEVRNMPILEWLGGNINKTPPEFDWAEKIELVGYTESEEFKGRVKLHHLGWLEIRDWSHGSNNNIGVDTKDKLGPVETIALAQMTLNNNSIKGNIYYSGPTIDSAPIPFKAVR